MFYKLGRAGRGAAADRGHRLRHDDRAGHARRAADRQGLRGGRAARRASGPRVYDAVVLDAPPTGRITRFLGVNAEVAGLAKVGPIRGQADAIMGLLTSPQTAVHLVTLLEEMPVQETADAVGRADRGRAAGRRDRRQRGAGAAAEGRRPHGRRQGPAAAGRGGRRAGRRGGLGARGRSRRPAGRGGRARRAGGAREGRATHPQGAGATDVRAAVARRKAWTSARSTSWPSCSAPRAQPDGCQPATSTT